MAFPQKRLAPAGNALSLLSIIRLLYSKDPQEDLLDKVLPSTRHYCLSSGTAALYVALASLKRHSDKKEVIIPAYSCPSLVAATVRAGLVPVLCDLEERWFRMALTEAASLMGDDTLAIIAVHLFGLPERLDALQALARERNVFLIEDAAQAFGNHFHGGDNPSCNGMKPLGTWGDLAVLSFGRGKPLSLLSGGSVVVSNPTVEPWIQEEHSRLPSGDALKDSSSYLLGLVLYSLFFRPWLYWIPESMPWLKLGQTIFNPDFKVRKNNRFAFRLRNTFCTSFDDLREHRMALTRRYRELLAPLSPHIAYPGEEVTGENALLRFPVVLKEKEMRDRVLSMLKGAGSGAAESYPVPLNELPGARDHIANRHSHFPHAKKISERMITLPLHEYVTDGHAGLIARLFRETVDDPAACRSGRRTHSHLAVSE